MSETAKAFSPQEVFPRVPEETLTKLQSLQPRWQNLPAGYGQVDREMGRGTLSFRATFASCGPYGEYRAVAIHSPAIAILNIFFFPASTLIYPVFAMEFVAIGQRGVVAVIDCKGSPGEKLAQSQAKSILLASHERFPHLLNGDDPPAWYEEARSGDDFFLRPEKPDVFSDLLDCHYFVWDRYTRNLIKASPTPAPISDSHSAFVADYKQHHAENSPGRPFLQKVFGSDWCETFCPNTFLPNTMPDVILKPINETVEVPSGQRLLDVLLEKNCPVMMACGGQAICATCHVYIEDGHDSVNPKSDRENRTLALITGARANSRLSCQCRVEGPGPVTVLLPEGLYVESVEEIETYIGKRTNIPIRHPRDGRVLIAPGKIITRTRIMELNDTDFSLFDFDLEQ